MTYSINRVNDIRTALAAKFDKHDFVIDKTGVKMVELVSASFIADEALIFGDVNYEYIERELAWYKSQSKSVYDIPGKVPAIWEAVSSKTGETFPKGTVNSNYGWMIYSEENHKQFVHALDELLHNKFSRRAVMIYTRPTMHTDYCIDEMSDFACTTDVQYMIRDGKMDAVVRMRSNDSWAGYRNDRHWQDHVLDELLSAYNRSIKALIECEIIPATDFVKKGSLYWNVGSQHVYEKDFYLIDHYLKTGQKSIAKSEYRKLYPTSPWV